jgi:hypothetical protein
MCLKLGSELTFFEGIINYNQSNLMNINYILFLFILFLYLNKVSLVNYKFLIILINFIGIYLLILSNDILFIFINIE